MPLKDLLVSIDASEAVRARIDFAIALARKHEARLTGLFVLDLVPTIEEMARGYGDQYEFLTSYAALRKRALEDAARLEAEFRERLRREDVAGEWRFLESLPAETAALHARYADLAIVGQVDPERPNAVNAARLPEEVLFGSGRPALIVPYAGRFAGDCGRILVGWTATREAARALNDALPLLERAKKVVVLTVNPQRGDEVEPGIPAADIAHHLAQHGVTAEAATIVVDKISTGDALLNYASDFGADLIVMGAYGHSRTREFVLGGMTRQILRQMTVPVLMSH
ncbi:MAG TPA: universal stress protein [Stellaceae bacterium]|nr:universal stress protein [Stellaceae bacterium]